ncbi:hypothetical protein AB0C87_25170 [Actinomadura sp. NPDC048021]|uniref:hypothetical protein n=1 Tax=Actinomadura sp. NPDC048021 TaxID=3155385 RepID=UPI0033CF7271
MLVPSSSQREFLEKASRKYSDEITQDAVEYLTGPKRGLTEEAIERHRLGVVADPLPGHETYRGWITIPYLTAYGVTTIRFRRLGDGTGDKYLTVAGDPVRIYNPEALQRGTRAICLTEGEFDCVVAEMCDMPCIGLPGAQSWQPAWSRLLEQYDAVFFLQDDDDAGRTMAKSLGKPLRGNLRTIVMDGGDVTSFFLEHGREALREKVLGK